MEPMFTVVLVTGSWNSGFFKASSTLMFFKGGGGGVLFGFSTGLANELKLEEGFVNKDILGREAGAGEEFVEKVRRGEGLKEHCKSDEFGASGGREVEGL